jgi:hypothetical protein
VPGINLQGGPLLVLLAHIIIDYFVGLRREDREHDLAAAVEGETQSVGSVAAFMETQSRQHSRFSAGCDRLRRRPCIVARRFFL